MPKASWSGFDMFGNRYIKRQVDPSDSKACFICYRPTAAVMVNETPNVDFFYVCESHLVDPGFAKLDPEYEKSEKLRSQRQAEVDQLKVEWESKQKIKSGGSAIDPPSEVGSNEPKSSDSKLKDQAEPIQAKEPQAKTVQGGPSQMDAEVPKPSRPVYELNRGVFKLRLNAKRQKMQEQKTKALLGTPGLFPQAPKHKPT